MSSVPTRKAKPAKPSKPTKADMLAARPVRGDGATEKSTGPGKWELTVSLKPTRWASLLLRLPGGGMKSVLASWRSN
jgi:hypothetical protein